MVFSDAGGVRFRLNSGVSGGRGKSHRPRYWGAVAVLLASLAGVHTAAATAGGNLLQSPEAFETWFSLNGVVVTPDVAEAPNATMTADRLADNPEKSGARVWSNTVNADGEPYVLSVYLKAGTLQEAVVAVHDFVTNTRAANIVSLSGDWQRVVVVVPAGAASRRLRAEIYPGHYRPEQGNTYAWGALLEKGTTPSPYPGTSDGGSTPPPDTTPPAAPTGVTAQLVSGSVQVNWSANAETDLAGYRVERSVNSTSAFSQVATPTSPGYTDAGVSAGNTYYYRVRAVDQSGNVSAYSAVASVTVPGGTTAITRGPYLQMASHTAMSIRWRTNTATNSRVTYGTVLGSLTSAQHSPAATTEHEVRIPGLEPGTKYYYAVGSTTQVLAGNDAGHYFITSPAPGTAKPTRVWVIGDAGTATSAQRAVRDAYYRFTGARQTDLWLQLGDNAYESGTDAEFQRAVFDVYGDLLRRSVTWPTRGNHERTDATGSVYYDIFTLPRHGEAGGLASGTEKYYSFDYGNIHFICLDSEGSDRSPTGAMAQWLAADLGNTTRDWIIAYWHHPPYSRGSHDSDREGKLVDMRRNFLPILEAGGVDLVLAGHTHAYERSFLLDGHYGTSATLMPSHKVDPGDGRDDGNGAYNKATPGPAPHQGAVYVVAGSNGKISGGLLNHPAMFISLNNLGSVVLDINGNRLDAKFIRETGAVDDYFTIIKGQR